VKFPFEVKLKPGSIRAMVSRALKEDVGRGDVTTMATVGERTRAVAALRLKEDGVIAGMPVFEAVFTAFDQGVRIRFSAREGGRYRSGSELGRVRGRARSILTCERVALNYLQHLSGIATLTRRFVDAVEDTDARIVDTRKTTPGLRYLEKYAVLAGGGSNHRPRLSDLALIKDNHIRAAGSVKRAVGRVRRARPGLPIEVEVGPGMDLEDLEGLEVDIVMLDNWPLNRLKRAVKTLRRLSYRPAIEVSGNVGLENVRRIALCGPDFISVGLITHSSPSLDISLDFSNGT
jgi:nicotinate-nucleotide pyrophosphorylase (carboxylating)